jgi:hypothetical protein
MHLIHPFSGEPMPAIVRLAGYQAQNHEKGFAFLPH